jgi:hypothetical protein
VHIAALERRSAIAPFATFPDGPGFPAYSPVKIMAAWRRCANAGQYGFGGAPARIERRGG